MVPSDGAWPRFARRRACRCRTGCPSGLIAARPGRRNPGVPRRETSKAADVAGQAQRAAVDRQRAAAVAHQLGGRQAARAVAHHRFWPSFWDAIIVGLVNWLLSITVCDKRHDQEPG
jgi:hypothetical protein